MPKGFWKGATEGFNNTAPNATLMALREVLQEPRTQAELEMAKRRLENDDRQTQASIALAREQLSKFKADREADAETRARANSPEQRELDRSEQQAKVDSARALADQRKQRTSYDAKREELINKDPELAAFVQSIRPMMETAMDPEDAAKKFTAAIAAFQANRPKKAGAKAQTAAPGKDQTKAEAGDGKVIIQKNGQTKRVDRKAADVLTAKHGWAEVKQ
jgi:hypothetical protein